MTEDQRGPFWGRRPFLQSIRELADVVVPRM